MINVLNVGLSLDIGFSGLSAVMRKSILVSVTDNNWSNQINYSDFTIGFLIICDIILIMLPLGNPGVGEK